MWLLISELKFFVSQNIVVRLLTSVRWLHTFQEPSNTWMCIVCCSRNRIEFLTLTFFPWHFYLQAIVNEVHQYGVQQHPIFLLCCTALCVWDSRLNLRKYLFRDWKLDAFHFAKLHMWNRTSGKLWARREMNIEYNETEKQQNGTEAKRNMKGWGKKEDNVK